ncbi:MAG: DUF3405 domain-containing protein [Candidatus Omnitrophica bacterium]|nr:DUF3405 domain-containing protein [Candidatus Omnitrophota bacterium]
MTSIEKKDVILLRVHFLNEKILARYREILGACSAQYDVIFLSDNSKQAVYFVDDCFSHVINDADIYALGYPVSKGRGLYYHMDYAVLHFFRKYPQYSFYWVIEYDVSFEGHWRDFFSAFADNGADVLATYVRSFADDPCWKWWKEHNLKVEQSRLLAIFCPVVRFSNRALQVLDDSHRQGLTGYCELVIPTLVREAGLIVSDIGKQFYDPLVTFNFNGILCRRKGMLHHPDKAMDFYQQTVAWFRYIFRAKYDSHWSLWAVKLVLNRIFKIPLKQY